MASNKHRATDGAERDAVAALGRVAARLEAAGDADAGVAAQVLRRIIAPAVAPSAAGAAGTPADLRRFMAGRLEERRPLLPLGRRDLALPKIAEAAAVASKVQALVRSGRRLSRAYTLAARGAGYPRDPDTVRALVRLALSLPFDAARDPFELLRQTAEM